MSKDTVYKPMWGRAAGILEAMRNPTKSVGYNGKTEHAARMVDGGNKVPNAQIHVEDEKEPR